jgi:predicted dehydrogenase
MISVALIGAGRVGRIRAEVIRKCQGAKLKAVADSELLAAEEVAAQADARTAQDWREIVRDQDIDAVVISTPTKFHRDIAIDALEAGKHVLCEKPLGRTLEEAGDMVRAAKRANRLLKTGFNYRHMAHVAKAKELIDNGEIGPVYFMRCRYGHGGKPGYEKVWCTDLDLSGGGVVLEQAIHIFDLMSFLMGDPEEVMAQLPRYFWNFPAVEDNCFCLMKTAAGQIGQIHVSWTQWLNVFELEIFGRDGFLQLKGRDGHYGPQALVVARRQPDHSKPIEQHFQFGVTDHSWDLEWTDFLHAIHSGEQPLAGAREGLRAQMTVRAAYESALKSQWVKISDVEINEVFSS